MCLPSECYLDPSVLEAVDLLGGLQAVQGGVQLLEQFPPDGVLSDRPTVGGAYLPTTVL